MALPRRLRDDDRPVRACAADSLVRLGATRAAIPSLLAALRDERRRSDQWCGERWNRPWNTYAAGGPGARPTAEGSE
jgi:HEAT repeat protein